MCTVTPSQVRTPGPAIGEFAFTILCMFLDAGRAQMGQFLVTERIRSSVVNESCIYTSI